MKPASLKSLLWTLGLSIVFAVIIAACATASNSRRDTNQPAEEQKGIRLFERRF